MPKQKNKKKRVYQATSLGLGDGNSCFYCGRNNRLSNEHIIPKALGTKETITGVCKVCNNEVLSELDKELCSLSPLSLVAAEVLPKHIHYIWDVEGSLLLEGRFDRELHGLRLYPQLINEEAKKQLRADADDMYRTGIDRFIKTFIDAMLDSFKAYERGDKGRLIFEHVQIIPDVYRLPPRIYCKSPGSEFTTKPTFIVRYRNGEEKRALLHELDYWSFRQNFRSSKTCYMFGTKNPGIQLLFRQERIVRALLKIGLNLLGYVCQNSLIMRTDYSRTADKILGYELIDAADRTQNGFVPVEQLSEMRAKKGSHEFWIIRDRNAWLIYSAFFGGRICTMATIVGPSSELWNFARVVAPYADERKWLIERRSILPSVSIFRSKVNWLNFGNISPSIKLSNFEAKEVRLRRKTNTLK